MKVDRILFALNSNRTYTGFWNIFSRAISKKFDVTPTLIFVGNSEGLNLSDEFGEIHYLPEVPSASVNYKGERDFLEWYLTVAHTVYAPSLFPDDVCMTMGIDQLPLSNIFFDLIDPIPDDKFIIGFSGAYCGQGQGCAHLEPSSHLIAKGALSAEILGTKKTWEETANHIFEYRHKYAHVLPNNTFWGLDEYYISDKIAEYHNQDIFARPMNCDYFNGYWGPNRIDRIMHDSYDAEKLRRGEYTEYHAKRPYEQYQNFTDSIVKDFLNED